MKLRVCMIVAVFVGSITLPVAPSAQERSAITSPRPMAYDPRRETLLQGTVLAYTGDSPVPPIGAHATVQTSSGITVDVHLGPDSYLRANHFFPSAGDSVKCVGVSITTSEGTVFLARIVQKGEQSIAVRFSNGFLRAPTFARTLPQAQRDQTIVEGNPR